VSALDSLLKKPFKEEQRWSAKQTTSDIRAYPLTHVNKIRHH